MSGGKSPGDETLLDFCSSLEKVKDSTQQECRLFNCLFSVSTSGVQRDHAVFSSNWVSDYNGFTSFCLTSSSSLSESSLTNRLLAVESRVAAELESSEQQQNWSHQNSSRIGVIRTAELESVALSSNPGVSNSSSSTCSCKLQWSQ